MALRGVRCDRQMHIQDAPSPQAVTLEMIPPANHCRRNAEIVGHGFYRVPLANFVGRDAARIAGHLVGGMFARSNWNNKFAFSLKTLITVKVVRLNDSPRAGMKSASDRGQRVSRCNLVVAPPHSHVRWNSGNRREVAILRPSRQMQFKLAVLWRGQAQQAWIEILQRACRHVDTLRN